MKKPSSYFSEHSKQNNISLFSRNNITKDKDIAGNLLYNTLKKNPSFLISPSAVVANAMPPAIKQWANSIYSFNKNYTKTLPALDLLVNKIIRSFFSLNPLSLNPDGKKSRLIERRFKRLSLNRIFVSKPEIKHNNDKVFVSVYLFNKKKRSLLYKLKSLYQNIIYKKSRLLSLKKKPFFRKKGLNRARGFKKDRYPSFPSINRNNNFVFTGWAAAIIHWRHKKKIGKSNSLFPLLKTSNKFTIYNHYPSWYITLNTGGKYFINNKKINRNRRRRLYINIYTSYVKNNNKNFFTALEKKNIITYKKRSLLTKTRMNNFIEKLNKTTNKSVVYSKGLSKIDNNKAINLDQGIIKKKLTVSIPSFSRSSATLKNYYSALNKYKLYKNDGSYFTNFRKALSLKPHNKENNLNYSASSKTRPVLYSSNKYKYLKLRQKFILGLYTPTILHNKEAIAKSTIYNKRNLFRKKINKSPIQKVNALYTLFTLYNNIDFYQDNSLTPSNLSSNIDNLQDNLHRDSHSKKVNNLSLYSKKISWNTYKLVKNCLSFITPHSITNKNSKVDNKRANNINKNQKHYIPLDLTSTKNNVKKEINIKNNDNKINFNKGYRSLDLTAITTNNSKNNSRSKDNKANLRKGYKSLDLTAITTNNSKNNSKNNDNKANFSKDYKPLAFSTTKKNQQIIRRPISRFLSLYKDKKVWYKTIKGKKLTKQEALLYRLSKVKGRRFSRIYIKRTIRNLVIYQKMIKINKFIEKYREVLYKNEAVIENINNNLAINNEANTNSPSMLKKATYTNENNIALMYKLNYIKQILDKDLLYIYYIQMLSFNTLLFKNWFLNSLKNILSKMYNKKVILNLVSLKYIHLNSDIFTQAITVRLRNFKKNRLNKVVRKALKLIVLSKINIYSYNIHSSVYKYIENYYSKYKQLNLDVFKDIFEDKSYSNKKINQTTISGKSSYLSSNYSPKLIKGLTSVQSSTIKFIRHKSVFGVRLEAAGRLTKRSTASRAIFKIRYKGGLRINTTLNRKDTSTMIKDQRTSNLQFTKISSKTRNGSFGLKGWLNNN